MVRDDPLDPDPEFSALYEQLPDATDLWPWLELARAARPPVLYLGIGAGRLAVPLEKAGIRIVGVDAHPGMLAHLAARLPATELIRARIEDLDLRAQFDLVMVPSNILYTLDRLRGAAAHVAPGGRLAVELANPHWLRAGATKGVRIRRFDGDAARIEIDYLLGDRTVTQVADVSLIWPEEAERWLEGAGLALERMFGAKNAELGASPTYYMTAHRRTLI